MRSRIPRIRRHKGLSYEADHGRNDLRVVDVAPFCNRTGRLERENPCEYRQPTQNGLLKLLQQVIAPGERGWECSVARQCWPPPAPKQPDPLVEQRRDFSDSVCTDAASSQF